jgi:hypothetical protein
MYLQIKFLFFGKLYYIGLQLNKKLYGTFLGMEEILMKKKINIKLVLSYILIPCLLISFTACKKEKKQTVTKEENAFEMKVAQNVVEVYMKALMKDDLEGAKKLYTKELSEKTKEEGPSELKVKGYSIEETSEVGRSGFFKIKVARMSLDKPMAALDETSIKIKKEGTEYKIDEVKSESEKEAYMETILGIETLRVRSKNNIKTNLLMDVGSLPQFVFAKDDKGNLAKEVVPRNKFSVMNFGYQGERIAVSSYDKDSFIGIIKIDESIATQGGGSGGGGGGGGQSGGGGGQGGGGGGQGGGSLLREAPIGKEMTSIDLIRNSKIEFMTFSEGEKFLLAQYNNPQFGRCIRVYNTDSGELIDFKFEEKYPYGKVEIIFSSFDKEAINFEVIQKDKNDKSVQDQVGKYQLDLKEFKAKRL